MRVLVSYEFPGVLTIFFADLLPLSIDSYLEFRADCRNGPRLLEALAAARQCDDGAILRGPFLLRVLLLLSCRSALLRDQGIKV